MNICAGEIVGVAGVEGNGQNELAECLTGLCRTESGDILFEGTSILGWATRDVLAAGIAHVPEDRHRDGAVLGFSVAENAILVDHCNAAFQRSGVIDQKRVTAFTDRLIMDFDVRCEGPRAMFRDLSGGNQQKLVLGRELARSPKLLIAVQPTRGLDVGAIEYLHKRLLDQRAAGMAILLISTELDEILALSDRVLVLRNGHIVGDMKRPQASRDAIGELMLGKSGISA